MNTLNKTLIAAMAGALIVVGGVPLAANAATTRSGTNYCSVGQVSAIKSYTSGSTDHRHGASKVSLFLNLSLAWRYSGVGQRSEAWAVVNTGSLVHGSAYCTT